MKKKKKKILIVVAIISMVAVVAVILVRRHSDWDFVRQATGLRFPEGTEYLAQYDSGDWYIVSVVRLPIDSIPAFIRDHRLSTGDRGDMGVTASLPERYRTIPSRSDLLSTSGRKEYQAWEAVLDPESRLLWISVEYPDWSGDHPGTAPQPPNFDGSVSPQRETGPRLNKPRE